MLFPLRDHNPRTRFPAVTVLLIVANAITFNIPVNGWLWSTPITYYVNNGVLMRRQDGLDREICRVVTTFQLTRSGNIVDIDLTVTNKDRYGRTWAEASSRRAYVRN